MYLSSEHHVVRNKDSDYVTMTYKSSIGVFKVTA